MAWLTADWPLDKAAKEKHMLPRTYASGWLKIAIDWGMTLPQSMDELVAIGNEPRNPKREQLAYNRIGKIAKNSNPQDSSNAFARAMFSARTMPCGC